MHLKLLANPLECVRLGNLPGSLIFIIFHQVRPAPEYDGDTTQLVVLLHRQGIDSMLPIDVDPDANWKPGSIGHTGEHIKTRNWLFQFVASRSSRPLLTYLRVCVCVCVFAFALVFMTFLFSLPLCFLHSANAEFCCINTYPAPLQTAAPVSTSVRRRRPCRSAVGSMPGCHVAHGGTPALAHLAVRRQSKANIGQKPLSSLAPNRRTCKIGESG